MYPCHYFLVVFTYQYYYGIYLYYMSIYWQQA